jgi:hypothetical protein
MTRIGEEASSQDELAPEAEVDQGKYLYGKYFGSGGDPTSWKANPLSPERKGFPKTSPNAIPNQDSNSSKTKTKKMAKKKSKMSLQGRFANGGSNSTSRDYNQL